AVSNCHSTGVITVTESGTGWSNTGGLLGDVYSNDSTSSVIDGCSSTANVSGSMSALGGLVGVLGGDGACTIQNSFATGNVTITQSSGSRAGGLVGLVLNSSEITNCYARGSVSANAYAGGLVG